MAKTLNDLLQDIFRVRARPVYRKVTVNVALPATLISGNNPNRVGLIISNIGSNIIRVSNNVSMAADEGLHIVPNGGTLQFIWAEDFDIVAWALYGVALVANNDIMVLEEILY